VASQTDIFNRALTIIGESTVAAPTEDTKRARVLFSLYDTTRDALLRSYRWGFAMKRAALPASSTVPLHQFERQFPLPSDFLRLDFVGDFFVGLSLTDYRNTDESAYALAASDAGTVIESNLPAPLNIRYIARITVTAYFDALFVEALAAKLGADGALAITESSKAIAGAERAFERAIAAAVQTNAIERPPVPNADDAWLMGRL
jgi:hypothetical protein